jgi:hypothetical protein
MMPPTTDMKSRCWMSPALKAAGTADKPIRHTTDLPKADPKSGPKFSDAIAGDTFVKTASPTAAKPGANASTDANGSTNRANAFAHDLSALADRLRTALKNEDDRKVMAASFYNALTGKGAPAGLSSTNITPNAELQSAADAVQQLSVRQKIGLLAELLRPSKGEGAATLGMEQQGKSNVQAENNRFKQLNAEHVAAPEAPTAPAAAAGVGLLALPIAAPALATNPALLNPALQAAAAFL